MVGVCCCAERCWWCRPRSRSGLPAACCAFPATSMRIAPPYPYNWFGFYIGGNLGAGFNNTGSATDTFWQHVWDHSEHLVSGRRPGTSITKLWSFFVIRHKEVMFDWLPNTQNTVNVTNTTITPGTTNAATRYPQQSMGNDGDWQGWATLGTVF